MSTPAVAIEWLHEKCSKKPWASVREPRRVEEDWQLNTGGRVMKAGLSLSIDRSDTFELEVVADGVDAQYVNAAINGVVTVLVSQSWSPVFGVRVRMFALKVYPDESSYSAFFNAGQRATKRLLGTLESTKFNIAWPVEK